MNYKISIIIPTFNIEEDIKRAIDSLLNQTIGFENLEIIIVDDCSTDNTQSIILNYCKKLHMLQEHIHHHCLETSNILMLHV